MCRSRRGLPMGLVAAGRVCVSPDTDTLLCWWWIGFGTRLGQVQGPCVQGACLYGWWGMERGGAVGKRREKGGGRRDVASMPVCACGARVGLARGSGLCGRRDG